MSGHTIAGSLAGRLRGKLARRAAGKFAVLPCLLWPFLVCAQSAIPFKPETAASGSDLSRVILALLACVLVLAAALFVLRKFLPGVTRPKANGQRLQVLATERLGPRTALHVVQFGGQQYLIGDSEHGLVTLANSTLDDATQSAPLAASGQAVPTEMNGELSNAQP